MVLILLIMLIWLFVGIFQIGDFLLHINILFNNVNPNARRKYKTHGLSLLAYFIIGYGLKHYGLFIPEVYLIYIFMIPIGFIINWRIVKKEMKHKVYTEEIIDDLLTY